MDAGRANDWGAPEGGPSMVWPVPELAGAVDRLLERHGAEVFDFLARTSRDPDAAVGMLRETFRRVAERPVLPAGEHERAWLLTIAHDVAVEGATDMAPVDRAEVVDFDVPPSEEAGAASSDAAALTWQAAASLTRRQYAVLDLSVRRGLSIPDIGDVVGATMAHAAALVQRAMEGLDAAVRPLLVQRCQERCEELAALTANDGETRVEADHDAGTLVEQHLMDCPDCQELRAAMASPATVLGSLQPVPLPRRLANGDLALLLSTGGAQERRVPVRYRRVRRTRRARAPLPRRRVMSLAAGLSAAALVAALAAVAVGANRSTPQPARTAVSVPAPARTAPATTVAPTPTTTAPPVSAAPVTTTVSPPTTPASSATIALPPPPPPAPTRAVATAPSIQYCPPESVNWAHPQPCSGSSSSGSSAGSSGGTISYCPPESIHWAKPQPCP